MGRWSFTNVGASASLQNVKYVKKIFEYMGYSEETDSFFSEQCGFKKPPVYYCMSSEDPRIEEQIHQVAALDGYDTKDLLNLLNALFPETWLYVYSSCGNNTSDTWEEHSEVYNTDDMTCYGLDKYTCEGNEDPYEPNTSWKSRFILEPPKPEYVQELIIISIEDDNPELTTMLEELAQKIQDEEIVYIDDGSDTREIGEMYDCMEGFDAETDLPFKSNSAREYAEQFREQCRKDEEQYISDMKEACAEGKSVWEIVERARSLPKDRIQSGNFEFAERNLDIYADISFYEKHFALSGFGIFEETVKQEIEKRGGIVHSTMTKKCDYLIVRLEEVGIQKVQKALEWREKGADNRIVTDYQLWQALLGETGEDQISNKEKRYQTVDIEYIFGLLDQVLDLVDTFDNAGYGVYGLTNGRYTTRAVCRQELFRFLAYIADGCNTINETQIYVLNYVLDDGQTVNANNFKLVSQGISVIDAIPNLTLSASQKTDSELSQQLGGTTLTGSLVSIFEIFGSMIVSLNNNSVSEGRFHTVFNQIKKLASQSH